MGNVPKYEIQIDTRLEISTQQKVIEKASKTTRILVDDTFKSNDLDAYKDWLFRKCIDSILKELDLDCEFFVKMSKEEI